MKGRSLGLVLAWMAGALLCFTASAVAVRVLAGRLTGFEILSVRNGGGLAIILLTLAARPGWRDRLRPGSLPLHVVRNAFHFAGQYGWNYGIIALPLATAFALEFTAPVWLAVLAVPLLGEKLTASRIGAILLGLAGVLVILRPGREAFRPEALVMLGAAFSFAAMTVGTKALTRIASTFAILFWMNLLQFPVSYALSDPLFLGRLEGVQFLGAATLAVTGLVAHLCLAQAYRHGDALLVMPLDFLRIPIIALVGWLAYGEALDPVVFGGAALIVGGIVWNLSAEARRREAAEAA